MFTGVWRDFEYVFVILLCTPPKKAKSLQMGPQNTLGDTWTPCLYDLGPIFGQIGPYRRKFFGTSYEGVPWMGPKSKIGSKMLWITFF